MAILNIAAYLFVSIADPPALAAVLRARCEARGVLGSILVSPEGVNLFLAGAADEVDGFLADLRADARFSGLREKRSWSASVPFRRLLIKVKPEIITFKQDGLDPANVRAPSVTPADLRRWLDQGHDDDGRPVVLVDTRNDEELAYGTFRGALQLGIDKFTELPDALEAHRDELAGKAVVTFCTGGIRCEKAAPWMVNHGYQNVLQLEGGILGYFEREGGAHYDGGCFVFDERVSLGPDLAPVAGAKRMYFRGQGQEGYVQG